MQMTHRLFRTRRKAFSLIELLVAIAVIALLIGLLLPALTSARGTARQSAGLAALRQMMLGYTVYQSDHRGQVLWGYTPTNIGGVPVTVGSATGHTFGLPVADRYPWRLAPYVDDLWQVLHSHAALPPVPTANDTPSAALLKAYTLSLTPTYGINSAYVGGHNGPLAGFVSDAAGHYQPNRGKHVVFHQDEPRQPAQLIVFAEAQARLGEATPFTDQPQAGLHFITAPFAKGPNWRVAAGSIENLRPSSIAGLPIGRFTRVASTAFFDGHAAALTPDQLADMRLWTNNAPTPDHDPIP